MISTNENWLRGYLAGCIQTRLDDKDETPLERDLNTHKIAEYQKQLDELGHV